MTATDDASPDYLSRLVRLLCKALSRSLDQPPLTGENHIAYPLALAWGLDHPANTLAGDGRLPERAAEMCDAQVAQWRAVLPAPGPRDSNEWNALAAAYCDVKLAPAVPEQRRAAWREYVREYLDAQMTRPFFFTSYNHEAQRCLTLQFAGELYGRDDWRRRAAFFTRQLLGFATEHGFWEEGPHHGPSMSYNDIMLPALAWMYRLTGEEAFGAAAGRLAEFQAIYGYPDGTTSGPFDGRVGTVPGHRRLAVAGLELAPVGRTMMRRQLAAAEEWLERFPAADGRAKGHFVALAIDYYHRFGLPPGSAEAPPLDADGAVVASHTPHFDGLAARRGPWAVTLSGQRSEVPKLMRSVFRLDRQSRIELWHEKLGVVVGGGHNKPGQPVPLANAVVHSGFGNVAADFGHIGPADGDKPMGWLDRLATFLARSARTGMDGQTPTLELDFAHAAIRFEVHLETDRATIRWRFEQRGTRVLALQLPVVVGPGGRISADGRELPKRFAPPEAAPCRSVGVEAPDGRFTVTAPADGAATCLRWPLIPVITYAEDTEEVFRAAPYHIGLLSTQLTDPPETGEGQWVVTCQA